MVEPRRRPDQAEPDPHHDGISPSSSPLPLSAPRLALDTCPPSTEPTLATPRTPVLQLRTDIPSVHQPQQPPQRLLHGLDNPVEQPQQQQQHYIHRSRSTASLPRRIPSIRHAFAEVHSSAGSLSPSSAFSSPQLAGLNDITPLPSPLQLVSPPWGSGSTFSLSRVSSTASNREFPRPASRSRLPVTVSPSSTNIGAGTGTGSGSSKPESSETANLNPTQLSAPKHDYRHTRNRSLSEYVPPAPQVHSGRKTTASAATPPRRTRDVLHSGLTRPNLQREEYLAAQRGITTLPPPLPTPPSAQAHGITSGILDGAVYEVRSIRSKQKRRYRWQSQLGQGAFSQVVLAAREEDASDPTVQESQSQSQARRLAAVKIVEYGPAGGADEERVEVSLHREVEILKAIDHPSIVQLKAYGNEKHRALLVLDYCPGGDLFEFASMRVNRIEPPLIERIFAELVDAVRYLHREHIVHRDIKLENVLLNMPLAMMQDITDWRTYPRAVITLTDLGLSRRIPQPPDSPLLRTRCGSEDYAAPEILMGQPYDGRSTDAWALGVLLYAIMENRLPFDPLPGTRGDKAKLRARTPHRIARCEWSWYRFADADGEWDPVKGRELEGPRACVEALLKRGSKRMHLDEVARMDWVRHAIAAEVLPLKRGDIEVP